MVVAEALERSEVPELGTINRAEVTLKDARSGGVLTVNEDQYGVFSIRLPFI